jgi:hypothetical protein
MTFIPNINAYCRSGPDPVFPSIEVAMKSQVYQMDGRNLGNTWYRIMFSASIGCWVSSSAGTPSGDTSGLRVLLDVPTPTYTPVPVLSCSTFTDARNCIAQTTCKWEISVTHVGGGVCVNK